MKFTYDNKTIFSSLVVSVCLALCSSTTFSDEASQKAASKTKQKEAAIKLESVFVGDKEQPAISYFIPWQGIGAPDKLHWNVEDKHDSALGLVDREIMLRSINIYEEMQLETTQ